MSLTAIVWCAPGLCLGSDPFLIIHHTPKQGYSESPWHTFPLLCGCMQLYVHLTHKHATLAFERLKNCLDDVRKWLSVKKLKLNPDKTEFIQFGSKNVRTKLGKFFPVNILGTLLSPAEAIRNLGVWFDSDFSFSCHVRNICKACFVHIRDLRRLRGYLTCEAALLAANALVGSRLDYCNSLFQKSLCS